MSAPSDQRAFAEGRVTSCSIPLLLTAAMSEARVLAVDHFAGNAKLGEKLRRRAVVCELERRRSGGRNSSRRLTGVRLVGGRSRAKFGSLLGAGMSGGYEQVSRLLTLEVNPRMGVGCGFAGKSWTLAAGVVKIAAKQEDLSLHHPKPLQNGGAALRR